MISQRTLLRIVSRQGRFKWGDEYVPGMLAVPGEAPKGSRISRINSRKLGRTLHLLSTPERVFTQLALYHPLTFELHEQKMLHPGSHVHPLHGHPLALGLELKPVDGTISVASRIGYHHAKVVVESEAGERRWLPHPYLGDLLLYMHAKDGTPYAVNWTVKLSRMDFMERKRSTTKTPIQQKKDRDKAALRNILEKEYYLRAGIETVEVSMDMIDPVIIANLDLLYGYHGLNLDVKANILDDFSSEVNNAATAGNPVAPIAIKFGKRWGRRDLFLAKIYQDIWERNLKVDFSQPVLIDHPLNLGGPDILDIYGSLFRGAPA